MSKIQKRSLEEMPQNTQEVADGVEQNFLQLAGLIETDVERIVFDELVRDIPGSVLDDYRSGKIDEDPGEQDHMHEIWKTAEVKIVLRIFLILEERYRIRNQPHATRFLE